MKVYIVTSGTYSDYGIERVFLDKEKAEKYAEMMSSHDYRVEEYETDDDKQIDEIRYVYGYYAKNKENYYTNERTEEVQLKIDKNNTLDMATEDIKVTRYFELFDGGCEVYIRRLINHNLTDDENIEKCKKTLYDLMAQIEYLKNEGWNKEMINKLLNS